MLQKYISLLEKGFRILSDLNIQDNTFADYLVAVGYEFLIIILGVGYLVILALLVVGPILVSKMLVKRFTSKLRNEIEHRKVQYDFLYNLVYNYDDLGCKTKELKGKLEDCKFMYSFLEKHQDTEVYKEYKVADTLYKKLQRMLVLTAEFDYKGGITEQREDEIRKEVQTIEAIMENIANELMGHHTYKLYDKITIITYVVHSGVFLIWLLFMIPWLLMYI